MPIRDYPLLQIGPQERARPMLMINITNPETNASVRVAALIDTGADRCAFPASVASQLGCRLRDRLPKEILTTGGVQRIYENRLIIDVLSLSRAVKPKKETILFRAMMVPVSFVIGLKGFLLGQEEFLDNFVLTIDYNRGVFSLTSPK